MKTLRNSLLFLTVAGGAYAQQWEIGGNVGGSFVPTVAVTGPTGSADTGFKTGISAGAWLGQTISRRIGGEIRYKFMQSNPKLASGGEAAPISGGTHAGYLEPPIPTAREKTP